MALSVFGSIASIYGQDCICSIRMNNWLCTWLVGFLWLCPWLIYLSFGADSWRVYSNLQNKQNKAKWKWLHIKKANYKYILYIPNNIKTKSLLIVLFLNLLLRVVGRINLSVGRSVTVGKKSKGFFYVSHIYTRLGALLVSLGFGIFPLTEEATPPKRIEQIGH